MRETELKADLAYHLQEAREAVLWKLEGLSEYDIRRPLTPTGTNLLGLVKHLVGIESGYLGDTFDRPSGASLVWLEGDEANTDMWATAEEAREQIVEQYRRAWAHSDATLAALPLDTVGSVPWWSAGRQEATLYRIVLRVVAETQRHAGHADIVRELIDGSAGRFASNSGLAPGDEAWWQDYRSQVQRAAEKFR
jgi:hypothetical protein